MGVVLVLCRSGARRFRVYVAVYSGNVQIALWLALVGQGSGSVGGSESRCLVLGVGSVWRCGG